MDLQPPIPYEYLSYLNAVCAGIRPLSMGLTSALTGLKLDNAVVKNHGAGVIKVGLSLDASFSGRTFVLL